MVEGEGEGDTKEETVDDSKSAQPAAALTAPAAPSVSDSAASVDGTIGGAVARLLLPMLLRMCMAKRDSAEAKDGVVSPLASVGYVKLLVRLSPTVVDIELPKFVMKLAVELKAKLSVDRDSARNTLVKVAEVASVARLHMLLTNVTKVLHSGFAAHIVGHVVHAVLVALQDRLQPVAHP